MTNHVQYLAAPVAYVAEITPETSTAGITAVALLKLLMRAETMTYASTEANSGGTPAAISAATSIAISAANTETTVAALEPVCPPGQSLPINDRCDGQQALSPYLQEQLKTITDALFNRVNGDFYRAYRGLAPEEVAEIVLSKEDLRPLAYRALMYEGPAEDRPFAPRFAASLLLLQKYWDCEFLQRYKDVAGRLSAYSISRAGK